MDVVTVTVGVNEIVGVMVGECVGVVVPVCVGVIDALGVTLGVRVTVGV